MKVKNSISTTMRTLKGRETGRYNPDRTVRGSLMVSIESV